jgi:acyl-coenzyme A synthetase/AMP-(fatty) acid ligase
MEPQGDGLYELVVLDGWPSKQQSNRADGAFCTNDLFAPHPNDPEKWRCVGRKDDTIILSNGENANPLPFEMAVRTSHIVRECVVYGQGRPNLVMLVIPDDSVDDSMTRQELVDRIWPLVETANARVPAYSRISKDAIGMLARGKHRGANIYIYILPFPVDASLTANRQPVSLHR